MKRNEQGQFIQIILIGLFVAVFFLSNNTLIKADSMQDVINQNDSLVVDQPNQTKVQATSSTPNVSVYSVTNSGTFGTCNWDIDDTGQLTIHAGVLGVGIPNWRTYSSAITSVYVEPGVKANSNSTGLFERLSNVTTIDINNLDTSGVVYLTNFFNYDSKLTDIKGIEKIDTSNVLSMNSMFYVNSSLKNLDVSNFDTKNVTDMSLMFQSCSAVITGLSNFDTSNVTTMRSTFQGAKNFNIKDIEGWNTAKVYNMSGMLSFINNLTNVDISNWDKSSVTDISSMFTGDASLTEVKGLSDWDTSKITNMSGLFQGTGFTSIPEIENWNTSQVTNMSKVFYSCSSLGDLDLSKWDTSKVTDMNYIFGDDIKLNEITLQGINNFDTSRVTDFSNMFQGTGFTVLNLKNFNTDKATKMNSMFANTKSLVNVIGDFNTSSVTDISSMFYNSSISDLSTLNIDKWDTLKVKNFNSVFAGTNFSTLPEISNWKTDSGQTFGSMFQNMPNLTDLDISKWNTSNATDVNSMFSLDKKLSNVDVSNFDTSNVKYFNNMFFSTSNLYTIDTSNWNTSNATTMKEMFTSSGIKMLDTSNWNTSNVTDLTGMFDGAGNIGELDLSNWDTSKVKNMNIFFGKVRSNIWKLKLGPKSTFTADAHFPIANANNYLTDQKENKKYLIISDKWQVVDEANGGTDHAPVGKLISNDDLASLYSTPGGPTATYVLQQTPFIDMKLDVPDLSFHKTGSAPGIAFRKENYFKINITNNTSPAQYVKSDVKVKMSTPIANSNGDKINGDLIFRDNGVDDKVISSDDTTILTRDFPMNDYPISWNRGNGFLMKFDGSPIKAGDYSGTLTWTLQNSL